MYIQSQITDPLFMFVLRSNYYLCFILLSYFLFCIITDYHYYYYCYSIAFVICTELR